MSNSESKELSTYRFWHSVQFRIIFSLGFLFLVVISLLLFFSYRTQQKELVETLSTAATHLNLSLQNSLELAMLSGQQNEVQFALDRVGAGSHIANIFITNKNGIVIFSSNRSMLKKDVSRDSIACYACHYQTHPFSNASFLLENGELLRTASVIRNKPACYTCHSKENSVNGILYLDYTLSSHEKRLALNKKRSLVLAALSILLLSILSFLVFNSLFIKKIKNIIRNIHAVENDDKIRLPNGEKDEFALINKSIQQMDFRIKDSIERIKRQRDFLQNIIDSVNDGLIVIDKDYRIVLANKAFCSLVVKPPEKIIGCLCHETMSKEVCDHFKPFGSCPSAKAFNDGANSNVSRATLPNGKKLLLEISAYPLLDSSGKAIQSIEIIKDITEKKQLEDELLQAEKMASLGLLASGIAHEINNPLATISTCADGMVNRIDEAGEKMPDKDEYQQYLSKIDKCVFRCKTIIDRLLAFSHTKRERKTIVNLNEVVRDTVALLYHRLDNEKKHITLDLTSGSLEVMGDPTMLEQLVLNLVTNGLDACEAGGQVTISTLQKNSHLVLIIADSGCGIQDSDRRRMFEPFFTTKELGKGTGLGLSICRQIVNEHDGKIYVNSEMNKGSVFEIRFPGVATTINAEDH